MKQKLLFLLTALMLLTTGNAWGITPTLPADYVVAGYTAKAYYNLASSNVGNMCPTSGDARYRDTYGFYNFGSGNRSGDVTLSVSEGDLVIFEAHQNSTYGDAINSVSSCTKNEIVSTGSFWAYDVKSNTDNLTLNITRAEYICAILVMEPTETPTHNYTINAVSGGTTIKELAKGVCEEDADYSTYVPQAILYSGQYYLLDDGSLTDFKASYTMSTSDVVKEINYTLNENVTAFWEGENMQYVGHSFFGIRNNLSEASNGQAATPYSGTSNGIRTTSTIEKGIYNITIAANRWADAATSYALQYSTDNVNWNDIETVSFASNSNASYIADYILIPGNSYLRLMSPGSTPRHSIDYVLAEKKADIVDANHEFVGAFDCSTGYDAAFCTTPTCIRAGEQAHFRIVNHNTGTGKSWDNWYLFANPSSSTTPHVLDVRPDQWCDGGVTQVNTLESFNYVSDYNGATVDIVISLADAGNGTYTFTSTTTIKKANGTDVSGSKIDTKTGLTQSTLYLYMSLQNSWIEILNQDVRATLGTNGYTTFASPNALDLTKANLPSGLKAYKAQSVSTTSVHFEEFDQTVPANTGILFEGTASETYNIPVVANGTDVLENAFEVNTTGTITPAANTKYYALIKNSSPMAFGWFDPTSVTIPANKAYIPVANGSSARLVISFEDDDPMAINAIEVADTKAEGLKDGKYFIGNRIILVKNGMKFNANGQILK